MSGPIEEKTVATGISGTNIFVMNDIIVIGQKINQIILPSISPRENSVWFEVRKPVEIFTGRKRELENLHKEVQCNLGKNKHKLTVISQITSISGLGGIGKSELARMYARQHGKDYDGNVIWINAETFGTLTESFYRLAKDKLNIPTRSIGDQEKDINSIVQEVYKYFSKRKSLFIFDNAEKLRTENKEDEGIDKFLPYFQSIDDNEPYIIITSRNQKWGKNIKVISIDTFTEEEALEFIKKELEVSYGSQEKEILKLAQKLKYFPLALQQAVAYIKQKDEKLKNVEKKFEIIDYLKRYEEKARELLEFDYPEDILSSNCYIKTTFITWEVTLEKIKQNKYGQEALEVLETIAYFAPDNIPIKIFLELVNGDIEKLGSILQLPVQYSMVHLEHGVLNINRLVQQVIRVKLKEQQKEKETLRKAIKLIWAHIEERNFDSSKYLPHAISTWNYASNDNKLISMKEFIEFSSRIANNLINNGRYQEAYTFSIQTLELLKSILRLGHMSTLKMEYNIALSPSNQEKHEIFQEVYNIAKLVLGAEHPSTLLIKYNISTMLYIQGKYDEALGFYQEVFNIQERVLGGEHPDILMTRQNITSVLVNQGKYDEALINYQEVFNIQERVLGREHPNTLNTRHNIALVLGNLGKYDEALRIYQEVFEIRERVLGGENPSTLITRHNIAFVLEYQGKFDEALRNYQEVFNIRERVLGEEHPSTLMTRHNIASVLDNQGKFDEALKNYQEVFNTQKRILGGEHPETLMTRHNIAVVLDNQCKYDEALGAYQEVFNIQKLVLGGEHPNTLMTRHNMAIIQERQGKHNEALRAYQEVFNIRERVLGGEHPSTLITRHNIARVLYNQGKYDEALRIYQEVFNIRERVLGREHPNTLNTRHNIALVLYNQGKHNEALVIYQKVYDIQKRVLGGKHPDALLTRHNMAIIQERQGKHDEPKRQMKNPEKNMKKVNKISFDDNKKLGIGSQGTFVFKGLYGNKLQCAVKRILLHNFATSKREIELYLKITHPNVTRYYCSEEDDIFVYIAMELAHCSLADYIKNKQILPYQNKSVIDKKDILLQTCKGLEYLHSQEIIHRDLKPHNILLLLEKSKARVLIADFGISKELVPGEQYTTVKGTIGWSAPELFVEFDKPKEKRKFDKPKAMDIFSLGCVFHYVLTDGSHPFGDDQDIRKWKIQNGKFEINDKLNDGEKVTILIMIKSNPLERPNIDAILRSDIF